MRRVALVVLPLLALSGSLRAQAHDHSAHVAAPAAAADSSMREWGQAAFAAIAEVVRRLDADPSTDWSKVNLEALRQHLIDMDEVTMRAAVRSEPLADGAVFVITGSGRTLAAIRRMTRSRAAVGVPDGSLLMSAEDVPDGARFTVRAAQVDDVRAVARIRALGFIGVVALGDHHAPHHFGIANGSMTAMHGH